jgi:Fic family protein
MKFSEVQILPVDALEAFLAEFNQQIITRFHSLTDAEISTPDFNFYNSVASVYSSKIEGEEIELDSYIKFKRFGTEFQPDYTRKTDDLYNTYEFAQSILLNENNVREAHLLLTRHILQERQQGVYRNANMYVTTGDGKIEYVAALPSQVEPEMQKLFADIALLKKMDLTFAEAFYFASMIHLVFVKIHPWHDGNGRTGRLLEKWFLSEKLGPKAWFIQSEKYYFENRIAYYSNIRKLGLEYESLQYSEALDFSNMLKDAVMNMLK